MGCPVASVGKFIAIGLMLKFVIGDGGAVIFTVLMSWFASIAMEPAVAPLDLRQQISYQITFVFFLAIGVPIVTAVGHYDEEIHICRVFIQPCQIGPIRRRSKKSMKQI